MFAVSVPARSMRPVGVMASRPGWSRTGTMNRRIGGMSLNDELLLRAFPFGGETFFVGRQALSQAIQQEGV